MRDPDDSLAGGLLALSMSLSAFGCAASTGSPSASAMLPVAGVGTSTDVTIGLQRDPALAQLMAQISPPRVRDTDSILVSFGTRHTMADTLSQTRGIGAASARTGCRPSMPSITRRGATLATSGPAA